jgi:trimethylamine--corrinoid protein Co-methyltransferase
VTESEKPKTGRRSRRKRTARVVAQRDTQYKQLRHPFSAQSLFSDDEVGAMHDTALRVLEKLGIKILLPEPREMFVKHGARVDDQMVFIGRDIIDAALKTAPRSFKLHAPNSQRDLIYEDGAMIFTPGSGCPNVTDGKRGRCSMPSRWPVLRWHN